MIFGEKLRFREGGGGEEKELRLFICLIVNSYSTLDGLCVR